MADLRRIEDRYLGFAYAWGSSFAYALMNVGVYMGRGQVPPSQLLFFRALISALVLYPLARGTLPALRSREGRQLGLASFSGALGIAAVFINLQLIPVGTARTFGNLSLAFIVLFAYLYLDERITLRTGVGLILMGSAVFLLIGDEVVAPPPVAIAVGVFGAVAVAVTVTAVRTVAQSLSSATIVWALAISTLAVSLLLPGPWSGPTRPVVILIVTVSVAGLAGQLFSVAAYRHLEAGVAATISRMDLVWAVVLVAILEAELPHRTELAAYALVMAGVIILQRRVGLRRVRRIRVDLRPERMQVAALAEVDRNALADAVARAEDATSCEFRVHFDLVKEHPPASAALDMFHRFHVDRTVLRNGVLICVHAGAHALDVVFDKGIGGKFSRRTLRGWSEDLARGVEERGATAGLGAGLPILGERLSAEFPLASDDANEIPNEVSVLLE